MFTFVVHISRYWIVEVWLVLEWIVPGIALLKNDCSWNERYRLLHCWIMIDVGMNCTWYCIVDFSSNLMRFPLFIMFLSYSSTCFEPYCAHHQEDLMYKHSIRFSIVTLLMWPLSAQAVRGLVTACALSGHIRRVDYREPDAVHIH